METYLFLLRALAALASLGPAAKEAANIGGHSEKGDNYYYYCTTAMRSGGDGGRVVDSRATLCADDGSIKVDGATRSRSH